MEGAPRSGSLITARAALDQGREVMAVPGSPLDARAGGCNQLIRDGATLVRSAADVAEALAESLGRTPPVRPTPEPTHLRRVRPASELGSRLLDLLAPTPVSEDLLIRELGQSAASVSAALVDLELAGLVLRHPGGLVSRTAP